MGHVTEVRGTSYRRTPGGFEAKARLSPWYALPPLPFAMIATGLATGLIPADEALLFRLGAGLFACCGWVLTAVPLCGTIVVRRQGASGAVSIGIGGMGRTRRFDWKAVTSATEAWAQGGFTFEIQPGRVIVLSVDLPFPHTIRFGSTLPGARRTFLLEVIRREFE